jgi:hypothetical protein
MRSAKRAAIEKHRMISLEVLPRSTKTTASATLRQIRQSPESHRGLDSTHFPDPCYEALGSTVLEHPWSLERQSSAQPVASPMLHQQLTEARIRV